MLDVEVMGSTVSSGFKPMYLSIALLHYGGGGCGGARRGGFFELLSTILDSL